MNVDKWIAAIIASATLASPALGDDRLSTETNGLLAKAEAGDPKAQFELASAYDSGQGAPRNGQETQRWYRASAEQGYAEAQNSLGSALQAEKRYVEALPWYEKAAAQNHPLATNNLAYLYDMGLGVAQDRHKGFELYTKAADLGWAEAMWNLANMYGAGQLGKADLVMACVWTVRAKRFAQSNDGRLQAQLSRILPRLETMLPPDQLAQCKAQGESWSPPVKSG
jgi:TPR repeat protein